MLAIPRASQSATALKVMMSMGTSQETMVCTLICTFGVQYQGSQINVKDSDGLAHGVGSFFGGHGM